MKNSDYELTYGVEIEFVLVFHQKLIFAELEHRAGNATSCNNDLRIDEAQINAYLEKNISPEVLIQLNPVPQAYHQTRPQYLAWGIKVRATEQPQFSEATYSADRTLRTYKAEHLYIAREVLRSGEQNKRFQYWDVAFPRDTTIDIHLSKPTTFDNWHLTKELVIEALTQTELEHYLVTYKRCIERDGPTSGQHSKRSLLPDPSSAGGLATKKQRLTQASYSASSSFQSNDSNQENLRPSQVGGGKPRISASLLSSFRSNDTNQESLPPGPSGGNTARINASLSSSSKSNAASVNNSSPSDNFQQSSNALLRGADQVSLGTVPRRRPDHTTPSFQDAMQHIGKYDIVSAEASAMAQLSPSIPLMRPYGTEAAIEHDPSHFSIVNFYGGICFDQKRRNLNQILNWSHTRFESEQDDCIGLLFPLPEYTDDYPEAPVVDEETSRAFNEQPNLRSRCCAH